MRRAYKSVSPPQGGKRQQDPNSTGAILRLAAEIEADLRLINPDRYQRVTPRGRRPGTGSKRTWKKRAAKRRRLCLNKPGLCWVQLLRDKDLAFAGKLISRNRPMHVRALERRFPKLRYVDVKWERATCKQGWVYAPKISKAWGAARNAYPKVPGLVGGDNAAADLEEWGLTPRYVKGPGICWMGLLALLEGPHEKLNWSSKNVTAAQLADFVEDRWERGYWSFAKLSLQPDGDFHVEGCIVHVAKTLEVLDSDAFQDTIVRELFFGKLGPPELVARLREDPTKQVGLGVAAMFNRLKNTIHGDPILQPASGRLLLEDDELVTRGADAVPEELAPFMSKLGVPHSSTALRPHTHGANKALEMHMLLDVLPAFLTPRTAVVSLKANKLKLLADRVPQVEFCSYGTFFDMKDFQRYASVTNFTGVTSAETVLAVDAGHYWTVAQTLYVLTNSPTVEQVVLTGHFYPEAAQGLQCVTPELFTFRYNEDGTMLVCPGDSEADAYTQPCVSPMFVDADFEVYRGLTQFRIAVRVVTRKASATIIVARKVAVFPARPQQLCNSFRQRLVDLALLDIPAHNSVRGKTLVPDGLLLALPLHLECLVDPSKPSSVAAKINGLKNSKEWAHVLPQTWTDLEAFARALAGYSHQGANASPFRSSWWARVLLPVYRKAAEHERLQAVTTAVEIVAEALGFLNPFIPFVVRVAMLWLKQQDGKVVPLEYMALVKDAITALSPFVRAAHLAFLLGKLTLAGLGQWQRNKHWKFNLFEELINSELRLPIPQRQEAVHVGCEGTWDQAYLYESSRCLIGEFCFRCGELVCTCPGKDQRSRIWDAELRDNGSFPRLRAAGASAERARELFTLSAQSRDLKPLIVEPEPPVEQPKLTAEVQKVASPATQPAVVTRVEPNLEVAEQPAPKVKLGPAVKAALLQLPPVMVDPLKGKINTCGLVALAKEARQPHAVIVADAVHAFGQARVDWCLENGHEWTDDELAKLCCWYSASMRVHDSGGCVWINAPSVHTGRPLRFTFEFTHSPNHWEAGRPAGHVCSDPFPYAVCHEGSADPPPPDSPKLLAAAVTAEGEIEVLAPLPHTTLDAAESEQSAFRSLRRPVALTRAAALDEGVRHEVVEEHDEGPRKSFGVDAIGLGFYQPELKGQAIPLRGLFPSIGEGPDDERFEPVPDDIQLGLDSGLQVEENEFIVDHPGSQGHERFANLSDALETGLLAGPVLLRTKVQSPVALGYDPAAGLNSVAPWNELTIGPTDPSLEYRESCGFEVVSLATRLPIGELWAHVVDMYPAKQLLEWLRDGTTVVWFETVGVTLNLRFNIKGLTSMKTTEFGCARRGSTLVNVRYDSGKKHWSYVTASQDVPPRRLGCLPKDLKVMAYSEEQCYPVGEFGDFLRRMDRFRDSHGDAIAGVWAPLDVCGNGSGADELAKAFESGEYGLMRRMEGVTIAKGTARRLRAATEKQYTKRIYVRLVMGFAGCSKSRPVQEFLMQEAHSARKGMFKMGFPRAFLRQEWKETMRSADIPSYLFNTFEMSLLRMGRMAVMDEGSLWAPGSTALAALSSCTTHFLWLGCPGQAPHHDPKADSLLNNFQPELMRLATLVSSNWKGYSHTLPQSIARVLGVPSSNPVEGRLLVMRGLKPSLPVICAKDDTVKALRSLGYQAYTPGTAQGRRWPRVQLLIDASLVDYMAAEHLVSAICRTSGDLLFCISGMPGVERNMRSHPLLGALLKKGTWSFFENVMRKFKVTIEHLPNIHEIRQARADALLPAPNVSLALEAGHAADPYVESQPQSRMGPWMASLYVDALPLNLAESEKVDLETSVLAPDRVQLPLWHEDALEVTLISTHIERVSREFHSIAGISKLYDDTRYTDPAAFIFPRHRANDPVLKAATWRKRLVPSSFDRTEADFVAREHVGFLLWTAFKDALRLPESLPAPETSEYLDCLYEQASARSDGNTAARMLVLEERADPDFPDNFVHHFVKAQIKGKMECKDLEEPKAGQSLMQGNERIVAKFGAWWRLAARRVREYLPDNVYMHIGKTLGQFDEWVRDHWRPGDLCTVNDYTAFDSTQQGESVVLDNCLLAWVGCPIEVREAYAYWKTHIVSDQLGVTPVQTHRATGESGTWLGNTLYNIACVALLYGPKALHHGAWLFGGDDMATDQHVLPSSAGLTLYTKHIKTVSKTHHPTVADFCGWVLTSRGIVRDPVLLWLKYKAKLAYGQAPATFLASYALELKFTYDADARLLELLDDVGKGCLMSVLTAIHRHTPLVAALKFSRSSDAITLVRAKIAYWKEQNFRGKATLLRQAQATLNRLERGYSQEESYVKKTVRFILPPPESPPHQVIKEPCRMSTPLCPLNSCKEPPSSCPINWSQFRCLPGTTMCAVSGSWTGNWSHLLQSPKVGRNRSVRAPLGLGLLAVLPSSSRPLPSGLQAALSRIASLQRRSTTVDLTARDSPSPPPSVLKEFLTPCRITKPWRPIRPSAEPRACRHTQMGCLPCSRCNTPWVSTESESASRAPWLTRARRAFAQGFKYVASTVQRWFLPRTTATWRRTSLFVGPKSPSRCRFDNPRATSIPLLGRLCCCGGVYSCYCETCILAGRFFFSRSKTI